MLYAFPFPTDYYEMTMDVRASVVSRIEVEPEKYHAQVALRQEIVSSDPPYYFQCPPEAEPLAWEALEILLPDMAHTLPHFFTLEQEKDRWMWTNHLLGVQTTFQLGNTASLPQSPLDWLGRQVQEDLILMDTHDDGGSFCAAGHLCFASGWSLGDKRDKTFGHIHAEVPEFAERIGHPADLLMRRLRPGRPIARLNWTIHATDQLNLAPTLAADWTQSRYDITPENAGERCFLRLERQTLTRLPRTGGVLFTIHTYLHSMAEVSADSHQARRLASVIRSMPQGTRDYKGITPYVNALLAYLDR